MITCEGDLPLIEAVAAVAHAAREMGHVVEEAYWREIGPINGVRKPALFAVCQGYGCAAHVVMYQDAIGPRFLHESVLYPCVGE